MKQLQPGHPSRPRRGAFVALAAVALAATLSACQPLPTVTGSAPSPTSNSVAGAAWSASASLTAPLGITAGLGRASLQVLGCDPRSNDLYAINGAGVNLTVPIKLAPVNVLTSGEVTNAGEASFDHGAGTADVTERSTIADIDLLGGMITATAVTAHVHVSSSAAGIDDHPTDGTTGSTFTDLKINGISEPADPAPNTTITLPLGLGSVVLNQQAVVPSYLGVPPQVAVDAIAVHVGNLAGITGTVEVAHAQAGFGSANGRLSAGADLASTTVAGILTTGLLGNVGAPCTGTGGQDQTADVAGTDLGALGSVGGGVGTVNASDRPAGPTATATETVAGVNLLGGLVHSGTITEEVSSTAGASGATSTSAGTRFEGLVVAGTPVTATVAPNTTLSIPGVGSVVLNQQIGFTDDHNGAGAGQFSSGLTANALVVHVTVANTLGLPIGATLYLGSVHTSASI